MSYNYRYINKQIFTNSVGFTLLIEDDDNDNETSYRIEKTFKLDFSQIDDEFLRTEALKQIQIIKDTIANPVIEEVSPDEALSDG